MEEVRKAAETEGVALNQLINVAVAEKVSALRTEEYFRERSMRANRLETMRILSRAGRENEPSHGDELPKDLRRVAPKAKKKQRSAPGKPRLKTRARSKQRTRPATHKSA